MKPLDVNHIANAQDAGFESQDARRSIFGRIPTAQPCASRMFACPGARSVGFDPRGVSIKLGLGVSLMGEILVELRLRLFLVMPIWRLRRIRLGNHSRGYFLR